jgi:RNA polymerase sigma factor for flagellar operon FliA
MADTPPIATLRPVPETRMQTLEHAYAGLTQALHRTPDDADLAAYLGLSVPTLHQWLRQCRGVTLPAGTDPQRLAQAIDALPFTTKVVLSLFACDDLTLAEIGQVVTPPLSADEVGRVHTKALLQVRAMLGAAA